MLPIRTRRSDRILTRHHYVSSLGRHFSPWSQRVVTLDTDEHVLTIRGGGAGATELTVPCGTIVDVQQHHYHSPVAPSLPGSPQSAPSDLPLPCLCIRAQLPLDSSAEATDKNKSASRSSTPVCGAQDQSSSCSFNCKDPSAASGGGVDEVREVEILLQFPCDDAMQQWKYDLAGALQSFEEEVAPTITHLLRALRTHFRDIVLRHLSANPVSLPLPLSKANKAPETEAALQERVRLTVAIWERLQARSSAGFRPLSAAAPPSAAVVAAAEPMLPMPAHISPPLPFLLQPRKLSQWAAMPRPRMNLLLLAVGTRGDVDPFISISICLQNMGHNVRLATHECYRKTVQSAHIPFYPLAGDPQELSKYVAQSGGNVLVPTSGQLRTYPARLEMLQAIMCSCWDACFGADTDASVGAGAGAKGAERRPAAVATENSTSKPTNGGKGIEEKEEEEEEGEDGDYFPVASIPAFLPDLVVANPCSFIAPHLCESLAVPLHTVFPQPWVRTKAFPHPLSGRPYLCSTDAADARQGQGQGGGGGGGEGEGEDQSYRVRDKGGGGEGGGEGEGGGFLGLVGGCFTDRDRDRDRCPGTGIGYTPAGDARGQEQSPPPSSSSSPSSPSDLTLSLISSLSLSCMSLEASLEDVGSGGDIDNSRSGIGDSVHHHHHQNYCPDPDPDQKRGQSPAPLAARLSLSPWAMENRLSYDLSERVLWAGTATYINRLRRERFGLLDTAFGEGYSNVLHDRNVPCSLLMSPQLVHRPKDWPAHVQMVGTVAPREAEAEAEAEAEMQGSQRGRSAGCTELVKFLAHSPLPPLYVGFGSMVPDVHTFEECVLMFLQGAAICGRRIVVQTGSSYGWASMERGAFQALARRAQTAAQQLRGLEGALRSGRGGAEGGQQEQQEEEEEEEEDDWLGEPAAHTLPASAPAPRNANATATDSSCQNTQWAVADAFLLVESVDHAWLFPQMAALVHHGGAGTVASGLRARQPTWVIPFGVDQPFWGAILHTQGMGPAPCPISKLTLSTVVEAFKMLLHPATKRSVMKISTEMSQENGALDASLAILSDMPIHLQLCPLSLLLGEARLASLFSAALGLSLCSEAASALSPLLLLLLPLLPLTNKERKEEAEEGGPGSRRRSRVVSGSPTPSPAACFPIPIPVSIGFRRSRQQPSPEGDLRAAAHFDWRPKLPQSVSAGLVQGAVGLCKGLTGGALSLVLHPARGLTSDGIQGGVKGAWSGIVSLVRQAATGATTLVSKLRQGIESQRGQPGASAARRAGAGLQGECVHRGKFPSYPLGIGLEQGQGQQWRRQAALRHMQLCGQEHTRLLSATDTPDDAPLLFYKRLLAQARPNSLPLDLRRSASSGGGVSAFPMRSIPLPEPALPHTPEPIRRVVAAGLADVDAYSGDGHGQGDTHSPAPADSERGRGRGRGSGGDVFLPQLLRPLAWQVALKAHDAIRREMHRLLSLTAPGDDHEACGDAPVPVAVLTALLLQISHSSTQAQTQARQAPRAPQRHRPHISVLSRRLSVRIADGRSHICVADVALLLANANAPIER